MPGDNTLVLRRFGTRDYEPVWREMQAFTAARGDDSADELWLVEHPPVYTLGLNAKPEHLLDPGDVPVVRTDRGGQVTYHGPGQAVVYCLIDLRRRGLGVKAFVELMEQAVIDLLATQAIPGERRSGAPGIYVNGAKIAALGLRVTRAGSYHGIALNVDMDLAPYARINPCGYPGMAVTQIADFMPAPDVQWMAEGLAKRIGVMLGADISA